MKDARSMKEQRESLPIFKLKEQLIAAVHDNQVCTCVVGMQKCCYRVHAPAMQCPMKSSFVAEYANQVRT